MHNALPRHVFDGEFQGNSVLFIFNFRQAKMDVFLRRHNFPEHLIELLKLMGILSIQDLLDVDVGFVDEIDTQVRAETLTHKSTSRRRESTASKTESNTLVSI